MTRDEILAVFERRQPAWRRLDAAALAADHAVDGTFISPMAGTVQGRAAIQQVYQAWFDAFQDVTRHQEQLIIDGDNAVEIATVSGTDTGGFMGLPPTGKAFQAPVAYVYTPSSGHITRFQTIYDFTGILIQIGMLRAKPV
jgi:predicted ester cyclase